MPNSKKWLRPKLEYVFISTKLRKIKQFYLFLYNFFSFAWDGKYSPIPIPQKVFNNLYYFRKVKNFWERNLEAIPKKAETLVTFLCLRNGKYVSDFFVDCFYLVFHEVEIIITIAYSSFTVFSTNMQSLLARHFICVKLGMLFESGKL